MGTTTSKEKESFESVVEYVIWKLPTNHPLFQSESPERDCTFERFMQGTLFEKYSIDRLKKFVLRGYLYKSPDSVKKVDIFSIERKSQVPNSNSRYNRDAADISDAFLNFLIGKYDCNGQEEKVPRTFCQTSVVDFWHYINTPARWEEDCLNTIRKKEDIIAAKLYKKTDSLL